MLGLIDPMLIVYLIVFFLVGYLVFASVFAAVGAAVNEMREAQSLMTPIMLLLMAPWFFATPIGRDPNSTFSVVHEPRAAGQHLRDDDPPGVHHSASVLAGRAEPRDRRGVGVAAMWFAAKVFKIGLLMHGKPPSIGTLIKWARMA